MGDSAMGDSEKAGRSGVVRAGGVLILVGGGVGRAPDEFLLMRHVDRWDLPKGHADGDESFVEAALRETREETGVKLNRSDLWPDFHFDMRYEVRYRKRHGGRPVEKHVRYFAATLETRPEVRPTEHPGYEWFPWGPPHAIQEWTIDPLLAALASRVGA